MIFALKILCISLIASIAFGVVDAVFFLLLEENLSIIFKKQFNLDDMTTPLILGGIAASISILCAIHIEQYLATKYNMLHKTPYSEAFGIIFGTIIVIILFKFYIKLKLKYINFQPSTSQYHLIA
uniref:Uncharacterized protein n=1 Tax=viral metagenome TaxID=1070528 RepID=A0A6C0HM08_9ZZZZ